MPEPDLPLNEPDVANAGNPPVPSVINMPDHSVRQERWFQVFVRLSRPTLDWVTIIILLWTCIAQPWFFDKFDIVAAGMSYAWAAAVYGIKSWEKKVGVS